MLDSDLAVLYEVPTKRLKEQVKRNLHRFPPDFMFQLTEIERAIFEVAKCDLNTGRGGTRYSSLAFTELGVAMMSSILKSPRAIEVNIAIMRTFIKLRKILSSNSGIEKRINEIETKFDGQFKVVFDAIKKIIGNPQIPHKRIIGLDPESKD